MKSCWGLTSGQAGMTAQVRALAQALQLSPQMKKIDIRKPFSYLPNEIYPPFRKLVIPHLLAPGSDSLLPPYPDIVISCGRRAGLVAMAMRSTSPSLTLPPAGGGDTRFIHIQDPHISPRYFDAVIAMQHDKITGPNVIKTRFALHAVTPETLCEAQQKFAPLFVSYHAPKVAVLLGGSTNKYTLSSDAMAGVIDSLRKLLANTQASLLITPSRRTGENNIRLLRATFTPTLPSPAGGGGTGRGRVYIYDFTAENPYLGLLACADTIIVTNDSVNMMSEAHATGKPIYILPLPGHSNTKPARFAESLIADGIARTLSNSLETWTYPLSGEMDLLAEKVASHLA